MGFFSKLFGKSEPENTQAVQQPAAPKPVQINLDADKIISLLGGKDNIADIKTCAFTRVRVELKAPASSLGSVQETGLSGAMVINDRLIHLLAGLNAEAACTAIKSKAGI